MVTAARIHLDAVVILGPARIEVPLSNHIIRFLVRLNPILDPRASDGINRTAVGNQNDSCQQEKDRRARMKSGGDAHKQVSENPYGAGVFESGNVHVLIRFSTSSYRYSG